MYTPKAYVENDLDVLHEHMRLWSFATLVTSGANGVQATHLPFLLEEGGPEGLGILTTHLARANPQSQDLLAGAPALVIFQGPHAFVTPSWYVNQMTFPTWNYTAIHARGQPELIEDPEDIHELLRETVAIYDTPLGGNWRFDVMPADMIVPRLRAIMGVRIPVTKLEGKFKINQDKSREDQLGVVAALEAQPDSQARDMAALMRRCLGLDAAVADKPQDAVPAKVRV
ncbi:FMN-binding negative transcriptional regulator [Kerstersia gyiorum]|jgi:transcriptional regulator|uniref:PaiB family negative transcriptional regulator n=1 Tax=Kerstersia gyiorum TaxID=206506 RepID=A0A4Q7MYI1_9BURK|nr:FMN-binding negative transcriptional regulator [Kerstersia gyiorum]AZV95080.1 hypothetical protein CBF45_16260 [Bordetella sp. J329]MCO7641831.1 FMN-binding negative transcriptional regulator [Pseudomonas sp. S 311-6]KAB0544776.1 FMN-binding negative transcriptional regulator [Kerstersia gyiorum]MCH4270440.1 FMN-binding negative transcriptional regulator [Kerstersia gyiorum]MCI1230095.1 FMN-binding negative transcriptional regulator [Kerstersia gyiorum]